MVYTINLKWCSYKQDISSVDKMVSDQPATYAILRYAQDIPESIYRRAMNLLLACTDQITNKKLNKLLKSYANVSKVGIVMDEEFVETLDIPAAHGLIVEGGMRGYSVLIEDDED